METSQNLLIKEILAEGVKAKALDAHFSVGNYPLFRINDELVPLEDKQIINKDFMDSFVQALLTAEQKAKLDQDRELIFTYDFDKNLRFKVNVFFQKGYLSATLRYIPSQVPTIDQLGLNPILKNLAAFNKGLVIVSGPFGSGRSSTAAAMIEEINRTRKEYIITLEKPLEYIYTNQKSVIEQREVGSDTKTYLDALSYFLEEDGDVLFLQEINDAKVVPLALEIARGSALVITTMGADSATKTVSAILDMYQSFDQERIKDLLAGALKAVVCQKLIPKAGGGSVAVQEVMLINEAVRSIITGGSINQLENIIQTARKEGMISMDQAIADAVRAGKIKREEALANCSDQQTMEKLLGNE